MTTAGSLDGDGLSVRPIGYVHGPRTDEVDDDWGDLVSTIELVGTFGRRALLGLDGFSHVEVLFVLHRVDPATVVAQSRVPRGNPAWPEVGIFAQRAKDRPNRLGLSRCQLLAVEGTRVQVRGLDAVDGSPVLDLKPWMAEFGPRGPQHQPGWATDLMDRYY